jgi:hypothetical protein
MMRSLEIAQLSGATLSVSHQKRLGDGINALESLKLEFYPTILDTHP